MRNDIGLMLAKRAALSAGIEGLVEAERGYKHPKAVVFIDLLPRNPSGKILKRLLRDRFPGPAPE